jgi:hypothetical protein
MNHFNALSTAVFDRLLAPFGEAHAAFDLVFWSLFSGIVALVAYKYVSNQAAIARNKEAIKVHLIEVRLFKDDLLQVLMSFGKVLFRNTAYLGHNLLPMLVLFAPMMTVLCQLEAHYAHAPLAPGSVNLLTMKIDDRHPGVPTTASALAETVKLVVPDGITLDAPPVRTADGEVAWRLRTEREGDFVLQVHVGNEVVEKGIAVGGAPRKVPVMRTKGWEGFLYPGEAALPGDSSVYRIALSYPDRKLTALPDGEVGILATFFGLSLLSGFALKGVFGVTL